MSTNTAAHKNLGDLQSKDHERLLNVVDELRSQGISRYIDLPQIVVVGDQSSGKSATLEAISGLKFPTKDALCTRFGTELILRHSHEVSSTITIIADPNRSEEEKTQLKRFRCEGNVFDKLGDIIDLAGKAMGLDGVNKNFSSDVLRIELCGPDQPHLTLVDLPGVFHSGSKSQSEADADAVKALVTSYIQKPRSIVLAVVSAKNDFNNQIISKFIKDFGSPARTLGLITKPDTLARGSDSERQYFTLAQNKDVFFEHGWHMLKNRDYEAREWSNEKRDASEKDFFSQGIWASLSPSQLGIESLRARLSRVLQSQISRELPNLIGDVESGVSDCEARLERLGAPRGTLMEQRLYLHSVSDGLTSILKDAVAGRYDSEYFGASDTEEGYQKRIRASVVALLSQFGADIARKGQMFKIVPTAPQMPSTKPPYKVTREERLDRIRVLIERNRGRELATVLKEETVTALFREQSSPWVEIVKAHAAAIFTTVSTSVLLALEASCDQSTRDGLMGAVIGSRLAEIKRNFDTAVDKVLDPYQHGFPLTYNHYLTENLQNARDAEDEDRFARVIIDFFGCDPRSSEYMTDKISVNTKHLLQVLLKANEPDMTTFACKEALNTMEAYYKVAMKAFVDDFAKYAVEKELLAKLETLFAPKIMYSLSEDIITDVCGETEDSKLERAQSEKKLVTLKQALEVLTKLDRSRPRATSHPKSPSRIEIQVTEETNNTQRISSVPLKTPGSDVFSGDHDSQSESDVKSSSPPVLMSKPGHTASEPELEPRSKQQASNFDGFFGTSSVTPVPTDFHFDVPEDYDPYSSRKGSTTKKGKNYYHDQGRLR